MAFNPEKHMGQIKGKDYLEVKWRIAWFRDAEPNGKIKTEVLQTEPFMMVKATVEHGDGAVSEGTGTAPAYGNGQSTWKYREVEKAETAAIGRALAIAGYGTQFTGDEWDEGDDLADSPVQRNESAQSKTTNMDDIITSGTVMVNEVKVEARGKNKLIILGEVGIWTREPFRALGYPEFFTNTLGELGTYDLVPPVQVDWYKDDNGYKQASKITNTQTGQVYDCKAKALAS